MSSSTMKRLTLICVLGLGLLALAGMHPARVGAAPNSAAATASLLRQSCTLPATVTTEAQLADCIAEANNNGAGLDTITLGADITLSAALPQITTAITIEGAGYVVDGADSYRVFEVSSTGNFTVNQITVLNGFTSTNGAGILNNSGIVTVTNSTFSGNSALGLSGSTYGAGIYNNNGTLTVTGSSFIGNYADTNGGAIATNGSLQTTTITNSTLSNNYAESEGGGIYNPTGTVTVTHSTLSGNYSTYSGGIFNEGTLHLAGVILDTGISGKNCDNFWNSKRQRLQPVG